MDYYKEALKDLKKNKGKLGIISKAKIKNKNDLSTAYTPGVAAPCLKINKNKEDAYKYTFKSRTVLVVTDGSAVLGLGNIGGLAGLPVMEGKCALFKEFADVDAFPISLATQDTSEIIKTIENIAPGFGGINLEDISAPRCFEIEEELIKRLDIPVFHDDQHGTAIVVVAGLINALKLAKKDFKDIKVVISGAGAAGVAITNMLLDLKVKDIILTNSKGIVNKKTLKDCKTYRNLLKKTNKKKITGGLKEALIGADVFIGVSAPNIVSMDMVKKMNSKPIIFAMSNPVPEIDPKIAKKAGAFIVATGRSDHENQINNVLAFPGIFRGALDGRKKRITNEMKLMAAKALANQVSKNELSAKKIIPLPFKKGVAENIANAVKKCKD